MTLVLIIWGVWSATKLSIDAVPDITNNQVQIITACPTLAGQEVEQLVTFPIEQSIANIPDLVETRSISRFGLSVVTVVFKENVDIYFARQLVNEKLKEAEEKIPKGIGTPELAPVSTGLGEVYQYIIHPKKGSEHKYNAKTCVQCKIDCCPPVVRHARHCRSKQLWRRIETIRGCGKPRPIESDDRKYSRHIQRTGTKQSEYGRCIYRQEA